VATGAHHDDAAAGATAGVTAGTHLGRVALDVRDLTVRIGGRTVLDDVSWRVGQGVVALVGPNGSGKTTLLSVLATLRPARSGSVHLCGHDLRTVAGAAAARARLGYLPQEPTALGHLTVAEAVEYAAWLKRVPRRRRADLVTAALVDLDLVERAHDRMGRLSGGTRQRAHIAQAVVHRPDVLLLDEPSTAVDAEHRVDLRHTLRRLAAGRLVVLSTHLTEDVELLADRVCALAGGRLAFDGTPDELVALGAADAERTGAAEPARAIERGLRAVAAR
jgi:ABC-2 type transport system ATP-binding protein